MKSVIWIFSIAFLLAVVFVLLVDSEINRRLEEMPVDSTCEDVRFLKDIPQERCKNYKY